MTSTAPDGRALFVWHDQNIDDLTAAIAANVEIFNHNGALVTLNQGKLAPHVRV